MRVRTIDEHPLWFGDAFRRVDKVRLIAEWFRHFLVDGKTRLPRIDAQRG